MRRLRAVALLAALSTASCAVPLMKLPAGPGVAASDGSARLAEATAACLDVSTISAALTVSGRVHGNRVRGRLLAGLAAPDSLYMEAPAPFGGPLFVLAASNGDATLLLPRDHRVLEHGQPEAVMEAIAGVPLSPANLKSTLSGCDGSAAGANGDARAVGDDWRILAGEPVRYLRRDRATGAWHVVSVVHGGADGWRVDYAGFVGGLPRSIRLLSNAPQRFDLQLELSQVDINVGIDATAFHVTLPPGMQPISIDELRAGDTLSR